MGRWIFMTGGLLIWAIHFAGVYAISSTGDVVASADDSLWRGAALAFSGACALGAGVVLALSLRAARRKRGEDPGDFASGVAVLGAGVSLVAIVWQTLPVLF